MKECACEVVICGGGIAGLWAMQVLRARGYQPVLLEQQTLGGGQTLAAQGILHGGMKYALDGKVDDIALRLREMPQRWLDAMAGRGELDLRSVQVLSEQQYMWSDGSLLGKASSVVGAKMLRGEVDVLERTGWPQAFHDLNYRGTVRVLKETVIDVKSAVRALAEPLQGVLYQVDEIKLLASADKIDAMEIRSADHEPVRLKPRCVIFTAGSGNEIVASELAFPQPAAQRRPLRQMLLLGPPWKLYGHCIVADPKPRVTITSHTMPDGTPVWYLGGNVAEKACKLGSEADAIQFTRQELAAIFPKIDWKKFPIATWDVDRAEPHQSLRFMPSEPTVVAKGNCLLAWPTKLVFAPGLAARLAHEVGDRFAPTGSSTVSLPLPPAQMGFYPWELARWKS